MGKKLTGGMDVGLKLTNFHVNGQLLVKREGRAVWATVASCFMDEDVAVTLAKVLGASPRMRYVSVERTVTQVEHVVDRSEVYRYSAKA